MSSENPYKVHIDLTGSYNFLPKQTLVHRQLLCKMTATIMHDVSISTQNIEYNLTHNKSKWKEAQNLNYLVTGVRGSGKSTFLKYLVQCLTRELDILETGKDAKHRYSSKCYIGEEISQWPKCTLLCQYDPSAPASSKKASFFLTVIAAIKTMVEAQQRENYAKTPSRDYEFDTIKSKLKKMDKGLSRLSRGEPSMSNMTEYQASKLRLDNDDQDIKLRELLDEVLEILCRICSVDAFIITIDDADTRSRQCADVMESLRLYVSHPRLVVILVGDKKLYTERIRELHFDEYQLKYHTHDDSGQNARMMSISAHANQYILKLFPSAHQYELRDLNTVLSKSDPISLIIHHAKSGKDGIEIKTLLREIFAATISQNPLRISIFIDQFLSLPLRSILEAMNYWTAHTVWDFLDQLRIEREYYKKFEDEWKRILAPSRSSEEKQPSSAPKSVSYILVKNKEVEVTINNVDAHISINLDEEYYTKKEITLRENKLKNDYDVFCNKTELPTVKLADYHVIHEINCEINKLERKIAWMVQVSLMHILQDEIRSYDSIHETLNVDTPRIYYSVLLRHCQNMDDLEHGFYLSGDMGMQREDKYITLLLAVSFKNLIKNLDGFISYIFFGPASVSLYAKAVEQLRREMEGKTPPEVEEMSRKFDSYLHVGSWDSPTRWARHANMIWCFDAGMEGIHSGILRLRDTGIVGELYDWIHHKFNRLIFQASYDKKIKNAYTKASEAKGEAKKAKNAIATLRILITNFVDTIEKESDKTTDIHKATGIGKNAIITASKAIFRASKAIFKAKKAITAANDAGASATPTANNAAPSPNNAGNDEDKKEAEKAIKAIETAKSAARTASNAIKEAEKKATNAVANLSKNPTKQKIGKAIEEAKGAIKETKKAENSMSEAVSTATAAEAATPIGAAKEALAILVSLSRSADRDNSFFISIFSYLAFILKCTHICDKYDRMENNDKDSKQTELVRTMKEYFLIKSCRSPEWLMRDKVVKTYNTCPKKMQEILEDLEKENQQNMTKFFNDVADEIVCWHAKNNDPENNTEDDSKTYTSKDYKHRPEDIYCNNMTPHAMGKFWSDLFYLMKSSSYEAEGFRFENYADSPRSLEKRLMFSHVQLYLEGKYDHIEQFANLTNKIFNNTFINTPDKLVGYYLERIVEFPLTEHFIRASASFFHYVSREQGVASKTMNADIPLKVFQEAQEDTIKDALKKAIYNKQATPDMTSSYLNQVAKETCNNISIINEFQKKLKQLPIDEGNQQNP